MYLSFPLKERMADKGFSCPLFSPEKEVKAGEILVSEKESVHLGTASKDAL